MFGEQGVAGQASGSSGVLGHRSGLFFSTAALLSRLGLIGALSNVAGRSERGLLKASQRVAAQLDAMGVVDQAVENGIVNSWLAERAVPFAHRQPGWSQWWSATGSGLR
jgi:hypothetical protein